MLDIADTGESQRGTAPLPFAAPSRVGIAPSIPSELDHRLRTEPIVWISSVRPDGMPHVLPIWFSWDGRAIWVYSKPGAQKIWNLRHCPTVMLALGSAHPGFDVELLEGRAEILEERAAGAPSLAHVEKYRDAMSHAGLTPRVYAERYSQPVRITPSRVLDWHARELASRGSR